MLPCRHKHSIVAENLGFTLQHCMLFQKQVNDDICQTCPDRCGKGGAPLVQLEMPTRTPEAITQIYKMLDFLDGIEKKMDETILGLFDLGESKS